MEGISLLITPATFWSPISPNLWMCLVRDNGLFIFLTQVLIWSHSFAVLSQLYWAWIKDKELHTHTSVQYPDCFLFLQCLTACLTILCKFLSYTWHVRPILAVSWQPHCLLPHIWAAGSVVPCFDLPLSQRTVSSPSIVSVNVEAVMSLQHRFIIQQNIHFSSARGTHFSLHYCGLLPAVKTSHSPVCQHHSTQHTKWEDCNHSTVSVLISIIQQWLADA